MGLTVGLMAASTAFGAVSSIAEGNAQASEYRYQAAVARQNEAYSAAEGEVRSTDAGLKEAATVGAIKTAQAARGIDVNTGSAVKVQESAQRLGLLDVLTIRSDAAREAYGYKTQAAGLDLAAKNAKRAGVFNAIGGVIAGAGNISAYQGTKSLVSPGGGGSLIGGTSASGSSYLDQSVYHPTQPSFQWA